MMIKFEGGDRPTLVEGSYVGELTKMEFHPTPEETAAGKIPQFGPYLTFLFKIVEPAQFANAFRSGICSAKRHPKSKLAQWLQAFGLSINDLGEQLDESLLVGKQVKLRMEMDKNDQLKIVAIGPVNGPTPVAATTPLSFKPAAKAPQQVASVKAAPSSPAPTPVPAPSQGVAIDIPDDDIPF